MVVSTMKEIFVSVFGKPFGIVLLQLLEATQFTIYLSLFAFFGGGFIGMIVALLRRDTTLRILKCSSWTA